MLRPKHRSGAKPRALTSADSNPLNAYSQSFLEWSAVHGRSAQTIETRARALRRFINWCDERDLSHPKEVTLPILERYQRYLYHYRSWTPLRARASELLKVLAGATARNEAFLAGRKS